MKTAIYIEDGTVQLVITPETDFEQKALNSFIGKPTETKLFEGSFYDCRGGWVRQTALRNPSALGFPHQAQDHSLILRVKNGVQLDDDTTN